MTTFQLLAPAKLTLSLKVTGIRPDTFHEIYAEMVTLELADELFVDPNGDGIEIGGPFAYQLSGERIEENLVTRALNLASKKAFVRITKNIPSGGGLGGGSADAAAILRWANFHDLEAAARIGADVPFCMIGGYALVSGLGEKIQHLPIQGHHKTTLVIPPFGVSTRLVYHAWDQLTDFGKRPLIHAGVNDLEPAAILVEPRLLDWKRQIKEITNQEPTIAGSGSTWWLSGHYPELQSGLATGKVIMSAYHC